MSTLIVGGLLVAALIWAFTRFQKSLKNNSCPGCSGGCSGNNKSCHH